MPFVVFTPCLGKCKSGLLGILSGSRKMTPSQYSCQNAALLSEWVRNTDYQDGNLGKILSGKQKKSLKPYLDFFCFSRIAYYDIKKTLLKGGVFAFLLYQIDSSLLLRNQ